MTINTSPYAELIERLRREARTMPALGSASIGADGQAGSYHEWDDGMRLVNPDGPEAADTITTLQAEIDRLRAEHLTALETANRCIQHNHEQYERLKAARIASEQATVERCAKVAEEQFAERGWDAAYRNASLSIATAIRSLSHTKGNDDEGR